MCPTLIFSVSPETYIPHRVEKSYFPSGNGLCVCVCKKIKYAYNFDDIETRISELELQHM